MKDLVLENDRAAARRAFQQATAAMIGDFRREFGARNTWVIRETLIQHAVDSYTYAYQKDCTLHPPALQRVAEAAHKAILDAIAKEVGKK